MGGHVAQGRSWPAFVDDFFWPSSYAAWLCRCLLSKLTGDIRPATRPLLRNGGIDSVHEVIRVIMTPALLDVACVPVNPTISVLPTEKHAFAELPTVSLNVSCPVYPQVSRS
jgi:hypothetical protein